MAEVKKDRGTVLFRPAQPGEAGPGARPLLWVLCGVLLAVAWIAGIFWVARAERASADAQVSAIKDLALVSFGVVHDVAGWPEAPPGATFRWGTEDRAALEARLQRVPGKSIRTRVPPAESWEALKPAALAGALPVPAASRVLDPHDPVTAAALQALFGVPHFLWVTMEYSVGRGKGVIAISRAEALVFDRAGKTVWRRVFVEETEASSGDAASIEHAMRLGAARAVERLARSIE